MLILHATQVSETKRNIRPHENFTDTAGVPSNPNGREIHRRTGVKRSSQGRSALSTPTVIVRWGDRKHSLKVYKTGFRLHTCSYLRHAVHPMSHAASGCQRQMRPESRRDIAPGDLADLHDKVCRSGTATERNRPKRRTEAFRALGESRIPLTRS